MSDDYVELHIENQGRGKNVLCCPECKGSYLHHADVTVWIRPKEDGPAHRIHIFPSGGHERWDGRGNPSDRRDAVGVYFTCENCTNLLQLTFAQHKGETEVAWRVLS